MNLIWIIKLLNIIDLYYISYCSCCWIFKNLFRCSLSDKCLGGSGVGVLSGFVALKLGDYVFKNLGVYNGNY
ncbi:MAG: hypothetical protein U0O28_08735 [Methanobrevibacter smithii]|uniref:hypothetical protein n=1 Tax=Methanobrevibacter smithii TaxID=2173 RepID=UPI002F948950